MKKKIGVGIITCNRPEYLRNLLASLYHSHCNYEELVIVDDGVEEYPYDSALGYTYIKNEVNLGVGKSKNKAMQHLLDKGCDYIFIIEDDMIIKRGDVFEQYIKASELSGIQHFNYGPGSPFNRKQTIQNYDLHNRHLLEQHSEPNPKLIIDIATLTGNAAHVFGNLATAIMGNNIARNAGIIQDIIKTGNEENEKIWELPIYEEYIDLTKSKIADLNNLPKSSAGASIAGAFLLNFLPNDKVNWIHLDTAGPAYLSVENKSKYEGATGEPFRTIIKYLINQ